jgi:multifunctional 2-oxoglutarate metabolism enzyme
VSTSDDPSASTSNKGSFGPNAWLVDDMYDRFLADPNEVSPRAGASSSPTTSARPCRRSPRRAGPGGRRTESIIDADATPLRGAAARIVTNMEASLAVPTATSVRTVSARLLEINRTAMNETLARSSGAKVSFTHFIAYAIVRAWRRDPAMNASFVEAVDEKGTPGVTSPRARRARVSPSTSNEPTARNLLVPVIRDADTMDFRAFLWPTRTWCARSTPRTSAPTTSSARRCR